MTLFAKFISKCYLSEVTQNARIFMVNDTADVGNWEGKTRQIYVLEAPELAPKNLSAMWSF